MEALVSAGVVLLYSPPLPEWRLKTLQEVEQSFVVQHVVIRSSLPPTKRCTVLNDAPGGTENVVHGRQHDSNERRQANAHHHAGASQRNAAMGRPVYRSHTLSVLFSADAETARFPPSVTATSQTPAEWPSRVRTARPVRFPSGVITTPVIRIGVALCEERIPNRARSAFHSSSAPLTLPPNSASHTVAKAQCLKLHRFDERFGK